MPPESTMPTEPKSVPEVIGELKDLTVNYAKQETVDPLKAIGRFVGFGFSGSFLLGLGLAMLTLGGLRALQTETGDTFTGNWSWAPYVITAVPLAIIAGLSARAIVEKKDKARG